MQKADWKSFDIHLKSNLLNTKRAMTELLKNITEYNLDEALKILENLIHEASELNISKIKICARSKSWWNNDLTTLRKTMTFYHRRFKQNRNLHNERLYKRSRVKYFHEIRLAK